ncbi:MAG TPA: (Fe-S)-binding protein, partial [Chloroflexota bacterium]|nr:(Fe-S)-binding protein [Chloroflexota bacterium]
VVDLTTFLTQIARLADGALAGGPFQPVSYHHFCQSRNVLGLQSEPLHLIRDVMGLDLAEMKDTVNCCGFGGSFSIDHPQVSRHIAGQKMAAIDATGAGVVVTDNPGCILHLRGAASASRRSVRVMHLADLVDLRLRQMG